MGQWRRILATAPLLVSVLGPPVVWIVLGGVACSGGRSGFDVPALERAYPSLARRSGHRLADTTPYPLPLLDGVTLFLCRWSIEAPIPVALPDAATVRERRLLLTALAAWSDAGLGLRFREVDPAQAAIAIEFADGDPPGPDPGAAPGAGPDSRPDARPDARPAGSGDVLADCAVSQRFDALRGDVRSVAASLRFAAVRLVRSQRDALGRSRPLQDAELLGVALHELGHALGYRGHARRGVSVMVRNVEQVRRIGAAVLAGESFRDDSVAALYAVPSGTVVGVLDVEPEKTAILRRLAGVADRAGWRGPYVRVGDRAAEILWHDRGGAEVALEIADWAASLGRASRFRLVANARAARLLGPQGSERE